MENPLEQPAPEDQIEQVHVLARDLAYGVSVGLWGTTVKVSSTIKRISWSVEGGEVSAEEYFAQKWQEDWPSAKLLKSFGYFDLFREVRLGSEYDYILTQKAFELLEQPIATPQIFISYKRDESSPLALLIEARLRLADSNIRAFIDKDIPTQTRWEKYIMDQVRQAETVVCLIGPHTLASPFVQDEINLAIQTEKRLISILHHGYSFPDDAEQSPDGSSQIIEELKQWQSITVEQPPSAEKYEIAINRMLNDLGYTTY